MDPPPSNRPEKALLATCGLVRWPLDRTSWSAPGGPIRTLAVIRIGLLGVVTSVPIGLGAGPFVADESRAPVVSVIDPTDPLSDLPGEPTLPTLALPAGVADERTLPPLAPLALPPSAPAEPPPRWATAWDGETPASLPAKAYELSKQDPDAYREWLLSTLPAGSRVTRKWALVTAYCPCAACCDERTGITATGRRTDVHPYGVAADFRRLKRGTRLHVPGYLTRSTVGGVWEVDDTGGAMRDSHTRGVLHLDVRFISHWWAERWGTRKMWVYVVESPE